MMHFRFEKAAYAAAFFATFAFCVSVQAQQHPLRTKHVPDLIRNGQASAVGSLETDHPLHLVISLPLRNEDALDALLQQIYDPQSPNFHHYLTPQQFTDSFEPAQQDYDAVVAWAKAKGLQVTATTANRRLIEVDAPAGTVNRAFNVLLKTYQDKGNARTFHAPDREPTVDLSVPLLAISGLDDANPPHTHLKKNNAVVQTSGTITENLNPTPNITASGPGNTYIPSDMRAAYYGSGPLDGTGQTVAIFSFNDYLPADLNVYYTHTGMTSNVPVTNVYVNGYNTPCFGFKSNGTIDYSTCDDGEQILDIVNVIGMAPGLSGVLFYEDNSAVSTLNRMAVDDTASVITSSWGGGDFGPACDPTFLRFQAQGQTYLNATGDDGEFNSSTYDPPSVDPNITQVGGTDLITMGAGGPWSSETGWADSGGGFMSGVAIPTWQQTAGVITATNKGSTTLRNSPDVAAEANFDNTTVINGKFLSSYGGTSFATPRWAGFIALANQQSVANGNGRLGFLNPTLYNIGLGATYAANFHDITSGSNGFSAGAGYDLVTGWGSPTAALIATLTGTASPDYSLAASPNPLTIIQGSNGTTTVTVTDIRGFTGSVALSASGLPTGVTASFSPSSTTGTSTLTLSVAGTVSAGLKTITITGISGSLSHTASLSLNVTSAADYSLSASPTSVIAVQGAAGTGTITVTPTNGFSGSVALSASGLPAGVTASFSPASATTTSTLTLTASSTATLGQATVTITGTSGSLTHTTTVTLTVAPAPDYSLAASPSSVSVVQGAAGTSTITVTPVNSFSGSVALSATGLPAGVTASFSPASATSTSTLTLTASSTATLGLATVTITGTSGSLTHTATVALTITPAPDYSLSASPNSLSVVQGNAGTSAISVTAFNNFAGSVALSASGLPSGVTAFFSPASATSTSTLTLTVSSTATLGLATVTITGTSGSLTHTTTVALTVKAPPDYSLSASPVSVIQGNSGTSTVTVTDLNGFTGAVNLMASGLPTGVTASFNPASTTGNSTLTLTASSTAPAGPATVTITGISGSLTHTTTVALTVLMPDYALSATANALTVPLGSSGTSMIAVSDLNGFSGAVNLSVSGLPSAVSAAFSPATTATGSTLTVTSQSWASPGTVTLTVTGTSGSLTHTTTVTLTVSPPPDFSFAMSGNQFNVAQGSSQSNTITVTGLYRFTGSVGLAVSGLPAGVTVSSIPASTTAAGTLTLTAASTAATGTRTITISGTSGSVAHSIYVFLTVTPSPNYSLSASPASVAQGGSGTSTVSVTEISGFSGSVALTASGLPTGVTASFSPASTTSTSTLKFTASSTAPIGPATVTVTGISGSLTETATVILNVTSAADYSLSASPASVVQGASGISTVVLTDIAGFTGAASLSASGLPAGVTASFSPSSTTSTSALTLTASSTAAAGSATITVTGISGSLTHTATFTLTVAPAPDYSLSALPSNVSIVQGNSGTSTIAVSGINSFAGSVGLSASGLPTGVTASFSPTSTTGTSVLTLTVSGTATVGSATITVTGVSGSLTHATAIGLTVVAAPDYSLSASPNTASVVQGTSGASTITVTGINGFTGSVNLAASGLPAGVTASFSPSSTTSTSVLTLTASTTATVGPATITITGTSGSLTHTTTVALTIAPAPDYSLSASLNSVTVVQGASALSTITVNDINSFTGPVTLMASGLPNGVTASFSPSTTTEASVLTITAPATATVGSTTITITGTSGGIMHSTTLVLIIAPAPDYSLAASPTSVSVIQGNSGTSTITVNGINSFTGSVALSASGLATGVTASFSPSSTTGTSILTLTASGTAAVGPATVTITGTSGSLTHTTSVTLTIIPAPDYSLSASPNNLSVIQGNAGASTITVTGMNNFIGPVALSARGLPAGVTASFSPTTTTGTSTLTLTASSAASLGLAEITICGNSGGLIHTTAVSLTVTAPPDYALSASPVSVIQGNSGTSTVTVIDLNGFTGAVNLSVSGLPAGVTASFNPTGTAGASVLTLTASANATAGTSMVTITGTSGNLTHTTTVALTVLMPDYSLSATANALTVPRGSSGTSMIAVSDLNGFSGAVNLSLSGLPSGVSAAFSPATTATGSTLTLTSQSWATIGTATLTVTGTSGGLVHTTTVVLTVPTPPDFSFAMSGNQFNVAPGSSQGNTITVTGLYGFTGSVGLTVSGLPAGVTASSSPASTTGTLTLTAASTVAPGSRTITITGTSGGVAHSIYVFLTVTAPGN